MTDQKTTLKTKAKTTYEINQLYHDSNKIDHSQWILLSDAEPLELEIQQLKTTIKQQAEVIQFLMVQKREDKKEIQQLKGRTNELAIDCGAMCYNCEKCRVPLLENQIETTKQILNEGCNLDKKCDFYQCQVNRLRKVFGETET